MTDPRPPLSHYFATAAKGTEDLLAAEIRSLGAKGVRVDRGGVRFQGDFELALRANLWSRTAMHVLVPLSEFEAAGADALYEGARAVGWHDHLTPSHRFSVEASVRDSAITHSHYAKLRVKDAIVDALRERRGSRPSVDAKDPDVRVVLHLANDRATLSLDLSGEPLFKRGYRVEKTQAPLKETLAAAVVLATGWRGETPFCDPMCGSGTIAIEAAFIGRKIAPGVRRRFGVERWPGFGEAERKMLERLRVEAREGSTRPKVEVFASDRDPDAVEAARANAHAAGVPVRTAVRDARAIEPFDPPATVAFNPPYGERVGPGNKALKALYWQLGQRMRGLRGHTVAVLAGHRGFEGAFGMQPRERRRLFNGPIECDLLVYRL